MLEIGDYNDMKASIKGVRGNIICEECKNAYTKYYELRNKKVCYFCYILKNIGLLFSNIVVCRSNSLVKQEDIITEMYSYIKSKSTMPNINYFSSYIKRTSLSITELCRIIQNSPEVINKLRIVLLFDDKTNISNVGFTSSLFDSDDEESDDNNFEIMEDYIFNNDEEKILRLAIG